LLVRDEMAGRSPECEYIPPTPLDAGRRELRRAGERIPVEPQVFDLILCLVQTDSGS
jgi:hypothetical protein